MNAINRALALRQVAGGGDGDLRRLHQPGSQGAGPGRSPRGSAAGAGFRRELSRQTGDGVAPPVAGGDEHPLVGGRPGQEQPAAIGRPGKPAEAPAAWEERSRVAARACRDERDGVAAAATAEDHGAARGSRVRRRRLRAARRTWSLVRRAPRASEQGQLVEPITASLRPSPRTRRSSLGRSGS